MSDDDATVPRAGLRLLVVPGVTPTSWLRTWRDRLPHEPLTLVHVDSAEQSAALRDGRADAGLVRLPVDRDHLSAIPLYTETSVVVVPRDHLVTAAEEVTAADLADEVLLVPADDVLGWVDPPGEPSALPTPATTAEAVELVASGVGVLVVPQSLARLHHRRDLTYRPVTDAPTSQIALAWVTDDESDLIEELIGIVRGRTVNSSRGRGGGGEPAADAGAKKKGSAPARGAQDTGRTARAGSQGRPAPGRQGGPRRGGRPAGGKRSR
ncbi:LysR family substrate-binding domain-containing protein [Cellulomonas hominis]